MKTLGTLAGDFSRGLALNRAGIVVGESTSISGDHHAFVYRSGKMLDLNQLIPAGSGWELGSASGINDAGQISGSGLHNGQQRGFLLTPR
jgi:probable HAF family extracellular repeat protein